jgi:hypothetical protein
MDQLDRVLDVAGPLLDRLDAALSEGGAPPDHELWTHVRRVRLLPGDAARAVAALDPEGLRDLGPGLRESVRTYEDLADSLPGPAEWMGEAADPYDQARHRVAHHLTSAPDSLAARLEATARLTEDLTGWMHETRARLTESLIALLLLTTTTTTGDPSAEAGGSFARGTAAADAGLPILRTIADAYEMAADLLQHSRHLTEPVAAPR